MSERLTDAEKDQRITELEELLEQADRHLAETVAEREGLRRGWKVDYELVPVLRAQLATERAARIAAEGREAGLREALETIADTRNWSTVEVSEQYEPSEPQEFWSRGGDSAQQIAENALATPANGVDSESEARRRRESHEDSVGELDGGPEGANY